MDCQKCVNDPSFFCPCSKVFLCSSHLGDHLIETGNHLYQKLDTNLDDDRKLSLNKELSSRINELLGFLNKTQTKIKTIVNALQSKSMALSKNIHSIVDEYLVLANLKKVSNEIMKDIDKILNSKLLIEELNTNNLFQMINQEFSKDFVSFFSDQNNNTTDDSVKLKKFLRNHNGGFRCITISNDERKILTGSDDNTFRIFDSLSHMQQACFIDHKSWIYSIDSNHDSSLAITGSLDRSAIIWDLKKMKLQKRFKGFSSSINCVKFIKDSNKFIVGTRTCELTFCDVSTGETFKKLNMNNIVRCALFAFRNIGFIGCGNDINIVDLNTLDITTSIKAHDGSIRSMALDKIGKIFVTCSSDKTIKVWNPTTYTLIKTLVGHSQDVLSVIITSDQKYIASTSYDCKIILWDINKFSMITKLVCHQDHINGLAASGNYIYSASRDSRIGILNTFTLDLTGYIHLIPYTVKSESIKDELVAYGSLENVCLFNIDKESNDIKLNGHCGLVQSICISNCKKFFISGSIGIESNLILWDMKTYIILSYLKSHENSVFCVDISSDSTLAASCDYNGVVIVWNINSRSPKFRLSAHSSAANLVKFSKNKKFVASCGGDHKVKLIDVNAQSSIMSFDSHNFEITLLAFTNDNKFLVSGDNFEGFYIWNLNRGSLELAYKNSEQENDLNEWLQRYEETKTSLTSYLFD